MNTGITWSGTIWLGNTDSEGERIDWYEKDNEAWSNADDNVYELFAEHYDGEETVLEIGSLHGGSFERAIRAIDQHSIKKAFLIDIDKKAVNDVNKKWSKINPFGIEKIVSYVNNGTDLSMIEDESVDFIFSFHSLVGRYCDHGPVVKSYIPEMKRVLKPKGKYFIHSGYGLEHVKKYTSNLPNKDHPDLFFGYRETL